MSRHNLTVDQVNAILPQTQCGLCDHGACRPYAEAIVFQNDNIDRCPPGGVKVLKKLGKLTGTDPRPFEEAMREKTKPAQKVVIREDVCIGCTKCIQACPVDAILGASKLMHTVITDECTGCELCIEPCPVDCIDIVPAKEFDDDEQLEFSNHTRRRYEFRESRLDRISLKKKAKHLNAKKSLIDRSSIVRSRQAEIQAAIARSKSKKLSGDRA